MKNTETEKQEETFRRRMAWARTLLIIMSAGVVILCIQYLVTGWLFYQYYALGLAAFTLTIISLTISEIIKHQ